MIIQRTIDKLTLKSYPRTQYTGRIYVVDNERDSDKAVRYLSEQTIVGIDSETRPSFVKGQLHKVALLQVATDECCFLFRLNCTGLTPSLITFLENKNVRKVGLSLKDDFFMLRKREKFQQQGCIELQEYVNQFGIEDRSLQKIFGILFQEKISKAQRLSNWESDVLTDSQKQYAAIDAWACLRIYNQIEELKRTGDYSFAETNIQQDSYDPTQSNSESR